jgi:hypothetical protein
MRETQTTITKGYKMTKAIATMVKYYRASDETIVLIKSDDSYVIIGEGDVTDDELTAMVNWEDVEGWEDE